MTKHEMPPFNMMIENGRLVPATPYDQERLMSFTRGTKVKVRFTEEKDRILVRKWFAILGLVVKQCKTPWKNKDEAHEAIKLALGIVNLSKTVGGEYMSYPKSLAELEEPELQDALEQMTELLSRMTGVDVATLKKEAATIVPEHEEEHVDHDTGEIIEQESSDPSPAGASDEDDAPRPEQSSSELEGSPVPPPSGSQSSTVGKFGFKFQGDDLLNLKDFARKALDDAAGDGMAEQREAKIEEMALRYRDAWESNDALSAIEAMQVPLAAVIRRQRSRAQAADYIARDLLGCQASDLEGFRRG